MPQALWRVRAFTSVVEMFFACALEEATTINVGSAADAGGQMKPTATNTRRCTTCVFPDPPCPNKKMWWTFRSCGGFPSSTQASSQAFANHAMNNVWSVVSRSSSGKPSINERMYALGLSYTS